MSSDWYLTRAVNETWAYANDVFTTEECNKIVTLFKDNLVEGKLGDNNSVLDNQIRSSKVHFLDSSVEDHRWIFQKLGSAILGLNNQFFNFDIEKIETVQFSEYDESYKGFYDKHIDMLYETPGVRKLSFSVLLTDPKTYQGGDLLFHCNSTPDPAVKTQGSFILFPSYTMHEVTPVTQGTRYALVGWVWGPRFR